MSREPVSIRGSGNPFADMGMDDADARLAKARLAQRITAIMRERDLTQQQLADTLGIDQPQVSRISRGQLQNFSLERLMHLVNSLNQDIEITVRNNSEPSRPAHLMVTIDPGVVTPSIVAVSLGDAKISVS